MDNNGRIKRDAVLSLLCVVLIDFGVNLKHNSPEGLILLSECLNVGYRRKNDKFKVLGNVGSSKRMFC